MFELFRYTFLRRLLALFDSILFVNVLYRIDDEGHFKDQIKNYLPTGEVSFSSSRISENFPLLYESRVSLPFGLHTFRSTGMHTDKEKSILAAKGEFLERMSAYAPEHFLKDTNRNFATTQTRDVVLPGVTFVKALTGLGYKKMPTSRLYYGVKDEVTYSHQKTTNGCGAHFDKEKAILSGWLELIQRDSFFVYWLNTISPRIISLESIASHSEALRVLVQKAKQYRLNLTVVDITSDILVPCLVCVVHSSDGEPAFFGLGASSGFNFEAMFISALGEALSIAHFTLGKEAFHIDPTHKPFTDKLLNKGSRILLNLSKNNFTHFKFFLDSPESISVKTFLQASPIEETATVKEQRIYLEKLFRARATEDKAFRVYYHSFKNNLIAQFDYHVIRVICEGLYPIYLNENFADTNHPRLQAFVRAKKLEQVAKLNTFPHPFP